MDVALTDDQRLLQDATHRYVQDRAPVGELRRQVESGTPFDRTAWREGAEQGWAAIFAPERHGGMAEYSQGAADAAIIAEELGRVVFAGPFLPVSVVSFAIAEAGSEAQREALLPGLAGGETVAAWCFATSDVSAGVEPGGVRVSRSGDEFVLDGTASYVQDAQIADHLLVSAMGDEGLSQFVLPAGSDGITITPLETLDLGRRIAEVRFEAVRVGAAGLLGEVDGAAALFERQLQLALVLVCAEQVGVTDRVLEFTLDYAQDRVAFGRPIGSFQALKHRLADHATQLEGAKAAAAYAAKVVRAGAPDAAIAVSVAKSHCGRFGTEIIRDCLQMHGGIGMTWEHDIHLYLRRAVSNEALWGTPAAHHERLCRLAGL